MPSTIALTLSKWVLDLASKLVKANVRLHNIEKLRDDMAVIFVVNHFTRLETLLLPYIFHEYTGREVCALAAAELFFGRIGKFLESTGTVSTKDPDRDKRIIRSLLNGEHPWLIFPEGAMIKDKKVVNAAGDFEVFGGDGRRPPHTGPAALGLLSEFYRHKIDCLHARPGQQGLPQALERFALDSCETALAKHTVIVPVNVTYCPLRAHENVLLRLGRSFAEELTERALDELSIEGTVLAEDTDIDVTLGDPIDLREYLNAPEYAEMMACGLRDMDQIEQDPRSLFNDAARRLMRRYMADIYRLTTINLDHMMATVLRHQPVGLVNEEDFRQKVFLATARVQEQPGFHFHESMQDAITLLTDEASPRFDGFLDLCMEEKAIARAAGAWTKSPPRTHDQTDFHVVRRIDMPYVIANELEPLSGVVSSIRRVATIPRFLLRKAVRDRLYGQDLREFEDDYARFYDPALSKGPDVGRPFLFQPVRARAGVVLVHGYMAAPLEVRALGEYLRHHGYVVYGVRLKGHGTSPEDLAQRNWREWYDSIQRAYATVRTLTGQVAICGFSMGGLLALFAGARKGQSLRAVVSICAPLQVRNSSVRFVPSLVAVNSIMKRMGTTRMTLEYIDNDPENKHINYTKNPLAGVKQLVEVMNESQDVLERIHVPLLVIQGSKDPTVNPISGQSIFDRAATPQKELVVLERDRHGIVNGDGSEEVFERVYHFLERVRTRNIAQTPAPAAAKSA